MARSALVIVVPEAESIVADHRIRYDPMAARGVPAHITVLHPFMDIVPPDAAAKLEHLCAGITPFAGTLTRIERFPNDVVYLVPEPASAFAALTARMVAEHPAYLPYGGRYGDSIPHLTIVNGVTPDDAVALEASLPTSRCSTRCS